ncbi:NYN domain protein [mine drainage metagenome]|jgi:uncharacterized LabA/DUF88 family protein|uniref:NYN domain protein n=1 Tax=mine drainage metagenome TaxID=410659 RepID=A0A1J5QWT1_9ZZZZ
MPTAILIDGAFFIKRFRRIEPHNALDAKRAVEVAFRWAVAHLNEGNGRNGSKIRHDLYRIFFYDCPPLELKLHHPITKRAVDLKNSHEARFRRELHELLKARRKVALRLGHLATSTDAHWTIPPGLLQDLLKGKKRLEDIEEHDVFPAARQKGVDMRIGVDIASLAFKRQVDQIVLIAGDADFVPAAKLARREGIDFVLDPMWQSIPPTLNEHIDGLRSTCPRPVVGPREGDTGGLGGGGVGAAPDGATPAETPPGQPAP